MNPLTEKTHETIPLSRVVGLFNRYSPVARDKRTVQRWLKRHGISGAGSSRHNWFYPVMEVQSALANDFPFSAPRKSRRAA